MAFIKKLNIIPVNSDYNIFINYITGIFITFYINNILIIKPFYKNINKIKAVFNDKFRITDFGLYIYYLSIIITRDRFNRILYFK